MPLAICLTWRNQRMALLKTVYTYQRQDFKTPIVLDMIQYTSVLEERHGYDRSKNSSDTCAGDLEGCEVDGRRV
jgi:hypothetical protein